MKRRMSLSTALALIVFTQSVRAQDDPASDAHHRNECRLAAQILRTGNPHPKHDWAVGAIRSCEPDVALPALVQLWTSPASDSVRLMHLYRASRRFRDGSLYAAARSVAVAPNRPSLARIAALATLAAQVEPQIAMDLGLLRPIAGLSGRWQPIWFWDSHGYNLQGPNAIPADARADVRRIAEAIGSSNVRDPLTDSAVRLVRLLDIAR